jgi:hypothetical protein
MVTIGALDHTELGFGEIDVLPTQAAQLGTPQSAECGREEQAPPAPTQDRQELADFIGARDVSANLQLPLGPLVGLEFLLAAEFTHHVTIDQAAFHGVGNQR